MTYGIRRLMCIQGCGDMARSATVGEVELGSAGEDDFLEVQSPPTDSSEDSVEVKVAPISSRNKRKCAEPRRVPDTFTGPLKKRMCLKVKAEVAEAHPFRPWSPKPAPSPPPPLPPPSLSAALPEKVGDVTVKCLPYPEQLCPVRASSFAVPQVPLPYRTPPCLQLGGYFRPPSPLPAEEQPVALVKRSEPSPPPQPALVQVKEESAESDDRLLLGTFSGLQGVSRREQRNYKNMTRERRIEANARERTRVHTISAAFDTLRRSVPAYSHNQKLSKLSVLRIACSYIKTLADIAEGRDDQATADSVDTVSRTIQREGKLRKKKDDND